MNKLPLSTQIYDILDDQFVDPYDIDYKLIEELEKLVNHKDFDSLVIEAYSDSALAFMYYLGIAATGELYRFGEYSGHVLPERVKSALLKEMDRSRGEYNDELVEEFAQVSLKELTKQWVKVIIIHLTKGTMSDIQDTCRIGFLYYQERLINGPKDSDSLSP